MSLSCFLNIPALNVPNPAWDGPEDKIKEALREIVGSALCWGMAEIAKAVHTHSKSSFLRAQGHWYSLGKAQPKKPCNGTPLSMKH